MEFEVVDEGQETNRIIMKGRLDAPGAGQIEIPFTATLKSANRHAILDMSDVGFVASLGIRLLFAVARVMQRQGRRMVLLGVQPGVAEVFSTVGVDQIIPSAADEASAWRLLRA